MRNPVLLGAGDPLRPGVEQQPGNWRAFQCRISPVSAPGGNLRCMGRIRFAALLAALCAPLALASAVIPASAAVPKPATAASVRPAVDPVPVRGQWANAVAMPGASALSSGDTSIWTVSCAQTGDCVLGGNYGPAPNGQAFVASGHNGTWGSAVKLPGTVGVSTNGGNSEVDEVACAPQGGYCAAAGEIAQSVSNGRAFVSAFVNGTWQQQPTFIPGLENIISETTAITCPTAGNCVAAGWYAPQGLRSPFQAFVASEVNGTWGQFTSVNVRTDHGGISEVNSASCGSPGNCVVSGDFFGPQGLAGFWETETNGRWLNVQSNPLLLTPSTGTAVSCAPSADCLAIGQVADSTGHPQAYSFGITTGGSQGTPATIPGSDTLNAGGNAEGTALDCPSAGNCTVGGFYTDATGHQQAFVAQQAGGSLVTAQPLPGSTTLNAVGPASIQNMSCPAAGDCSASGFYTDASGNEQILIADEISGIWTTATRLPGATSTGFSAGAHVACWAPARCTAVGAVTSAGHLSALVATESPSATPAAGHWATAAPVPGVAALNKNGHATTTGLSCAPSADCAIAGSYTDSFGQPQAWVADGHAGIWGTATPLPGTTDATSDGGHSEVTSLSCVSGIYCAAAGDLATGPAQQSQRAMVAVDNRGTWGGATVIPGLENTVAKALTVSCASVGNCVAGGWYLDPANNRDIAFTANEVNGTWQKFSQIPLPPSPNSTGTETDMVSCPVAGQCVATGTVEAPEAMWESVETPNNTWLNGLIQGIFGPPPSDAALPSHARALSCSTPQNCVAVGTFTTSSGGTQPYVHERDTNGGPTDGWGLANPIPNMAVLGAAFAEPNAVACPAPGDCVVAGVYTDGSLHSQAFLAEERGGVWGNAFTVPGSLSLNAGNAAALQSVSCASPGNCAATGFFTDANGDEQFLAIDEVNGIWATATTVPTAVTPGAVANTSVSCWAPENCVTAGAIDPATQFQPVSSLETPAAP